MIYNMEENKHNPTISSPERSMAKHFFLIKYKTEDQRRAYSDIVVELTKNHELKDFHIAEEIAFQEPRILYNMKTILKNEELDYNLLEKRFLEFYEC